MGSFDGDSSFGWDRLGKRGAVTSQVVLVLYVRRSADVPPQSTVLETLASNDVENPNVTQGLGSMGLAAVLTSSCKVPCHFTGV